MNKKSLFLVLHLLLISIFSFSQDEEKTLKVISYNIWNGFDWGKDQARRAELQSWMTTQQPDVVALQELCKYTPEKLKEDAKAWGHEYYVLLKEDGYSVGLTSRFPIEVKEKIKEGMHHGALHCKTAGIDFLVVHLHPGSIKRRREEAGVLLEKLTEIRKDNTRFMVLGDFNAHSPFDDHFYRENKFADHLKKSNHDNDINGNLLYSELDYAVISEFLAFPLYDVIHKYILSMNKLGTFPAMALASVNNLSFENLLKRYERIDYILASSALYESCVSAIVHNEKANWFLSDHYPVEANFKIEK
ncbi:MAG: endonuclease/exonuclease/phosphatase family protein [Marinilabiliaceae bacterium]|nr:endonuclease/exonuclease/phosphatase family protein [Marinilabiliaceae bacterium]